MGKLWHIYDQLDGLRAQAQQAPSPALDAQIALWEADLAAVLDEERRETGWYLRINLVGEDGGPARTLGWVRDAWGHTGRVKGEGARVKAKRDRFETLCYHSPTVAEAGVW